VAVAAGFEAEHARAAAGVVRLAAVLMFAADAVMKPGGAAASFMTAVAGFASRGADAVASGARFAFDSESLSESGAVEARVGQGWMTTIVAAASSSVVFTACQPSGSFGSVQAKSHCASVGDRFTQPPECPSPHWSCQ
jgi:hypothetical protein